MAEDGWRQHDALPLLRGRSGRWLGDRMVIETSEPRARNLFWCSEWPHPDGKPPDSFALDHCPPASLNGPALAPPDLLIKVAASRSDPLAAAFVSVHTSLVFGLLGYLGSPCTVPSSPLSYVTRPPPLFLSSLLSLLTWLYSSNLGAYCHICCIDDLAIVHRIASFLKLTQVLNALSNEPFVSIIQRYNQSQMERASSSSGNGYISSGGARHVGRLHGFELTLRDMSNFHMLFFDTIDMPCRTKFLQDGVLIVDRCAMFILDISKIIVPRGDPYSEHQMRSYCILVPKNDSSLAVYALLSYCHFLTLHARVHNQEIPLRGPFDHLDVDEIATIAFTRSTDGVPSTSDMEYIKYKAGSDSPSLTIEEEGDMVKYSGTFKNIVYFFYNISESMKSMRGVPTTIMIQRISFSHFSWLLDGGIKKCYFDSARHIIVIKEQLYYLMYELIFVQDYPEVCAISPDIPDRESHPKFVEICLD